VNPLHPGGWDTVQGGPASPTDAFEEWLLTLGSTAENIHRTPHRTVG